MKSRLSDDDAAASLSKVRCMLACHASATSLQKELDSIATTVSRACTISITL